MPRPHQTPRGRTLDARLDSYFAGLGMGVNPHLLRQERADLLAWLEAKSEAELALMGLARADIPAFVFRDLFGEGRLR